MEKHQYHPVSRILHWISALVILWATFSGFTVAFGNVGEETAEQIGNFNVAITLVFIPFFIMRILAIWRYGKPDTPELSARQQRVAEIAHIAIYVCISVVLVSGVLMMDRPMSVFGLYELQPFLTSQTLTDGFFELHRYSCMVLAVLVTMHLAATLKHHMSGVNLLQKMV